MIVPELLERFGRNARENFIVYSNGNAHAVAFTRAETSRKYHFIVEFLLLNTLFEQRPDFGRAL